MWSRRSWRVLSRPSPPYSPSSARHHTLGQAQVPSRSHSHSPLAASSHPSNLAQVYISRSTDPYVNLSIEHHLLQTTPPDSAVLFLYTNRPCVVIGRNQNPWLEVNLGRLRQPGLLTPIAAPWADQAAASATQGEASSQDSRSGGNGTDAGAGAGAGADVVDLVRRRSGGGTVFHDLGNVNYSVLCAPSAFDRNKHADMVVRALGGLGVASARVNERHDIVVAGPQYEDELGGGGGGGGNGGGSSSTFKVSGSAYKLTRLRSLHHGTCLLASPNLAAVGAYLRSPAAPYIRARGVDSVRSAIRNVGVSPLDFEEAVCREFARMYDGAGAPVFLTEADADGIESVHKGVEELKSLDWKYTQTPQFTFSTHPTEADPRPRPSAAPLTLALTVRHGQVTEASGQDSASSLQGQLVHRIADWRPHVGKDGGRWLNSLFGVGG